MTPTTDQALRELRQEDLLRAPCAACGSQLTFRAETQQLACTHCNATQPLVFTQTKLRENPLANGLVSQELRLDRVVEERLFCCANCGARTRVSAEAPTLSCGFCGNRAINPEAQRTRLIEPAGVLPFRLGREAALGVFQRWIGNGWLAPNDLKAGAVLDNLHGIYLPFWTVDAHAHSTWSGERGTYYYETKTERDSQGRTVTRQERHTSWSYRSGTHGQFYDDVLLLASTSLQQQTLALGVVQQDFHLPDVVDYDPRVLLGWEAEVYSIDLHAGLAQARTIIREREHDACSNELGGDEQRGLEVRTTLTDESFKHLLLPLWLCAYVYRGQLYHFLINGQTGAISGSRPTSPWKVALLVVLSLVLLAGAYWAWQCYGNQ
jgi:DNA-directed RNA polymerase subunit RPC12/RpoP